MIEEMFEKMPLSENNFIFPRDLGKIRILINFETTIGGSVAGEILNF